MESCKRITLTLTPCVTERQLGQPTTAIPKGGLPPLEPWLPRHHRMGTKWSHGGVQFGTGAGSFSGRLCAGMESGYGRKLILVQRD